MILIQTYRHVTTPQYYQILFSYKALGIGFYREDKYICIRPSKKAWENHTLIQFTATTMEWVNETSSNL